MYRTDRVELLPATADHPVLGLEPGGRLRHAPATRTTRTSRTRSRSTRRCRRRSWRCPRTSVDGVEVYTRDPQVGFFRVWRTAVGVGRVDRRLRDLEPLLVDARRPRRPAARSRRAYLANIVDALGDGVRVVAGGDFNVFPRPDDPLQPPSDQLGPLYDQGLENLWDTLVAEVPAAAYSYVFVGMAQTLDGQFVTDNLLAELEQTRVAHVNADFAAEFPGDGARGLSDHDPMSSRFALEATLERLEALLALLLRERCDHREQHLHAAPEPPRPGRARSATPSSGPSSARCGTRHRGSSRRPQPRLSSPRHSCF